MKLYFKNKAMHIFLSIALIFSLSLSTSRCDDWDDFDDEFDIDFPETPAEEPMTTETRTGSPQLTAAIVNLTLNISEPLWIHTKPPKGRDVLYLIPHKLTAIEYGGVVFNLFFNYTNKMAFSIDEVLKLTDDLETRFQTVIRELTRITTDAQASSVIPLFKKLTIQERKAGALIQAGFISGAFTFQLNTSLQISERNFWLNKNDQEELKRLFGEEDKTFDQKELYRIRYGLGDTRIKAGLNALNTSSFQLDVGTEIILPTSDVSSLPKLRDYDINFSNIQNNIVDLLYGMRDNLIDARLGNNGHYGLGFYVESKFSAFHDFMHLWGRASFDNLFSAREDRLIPSRQTMVAPANYTGPGGSIAYLAIINTDPEKQTEFLKQFILPPPYRVTIKPGGIVNFILNATFNISNHWSLGLGYDYYHQQREYIDKIHNLGDEINTLRISDAETESSRQHKIITEVNWVKSQKGWDLNLGLGGDYTISSDNMGHDWTIFLRIGASF